LKEQDLLMAEKKIKWTDQQKRAIDSRGSTVMVTASAGTGKTAVLSGRCVNIISDKSICPDVRGILVLTFTDAAAEQMRSRIAGRLKDAFLQKRDAHLRRQLMLLQGADISTIHSFCKRLITEYFYKLDIDPTFGVIDADEQKLLKTEALEKTIDQVWQENCIRQPLEQLLYRRDLRTNDGFLTRIIELSNFLDGVISRRKWYEKAAQLAELTDPFATDLGDKQKQIVAVKLQSIIEQLNHARRLCESQGGQADWNEKLQDSHIEPVASCIELLKSGDWDKCAEAIRSFHKPTTRKPKGLSESIAALIQSTAKNAVDELAELSQLAIVNPDYLDMLDGLVGPQTRVLIELIKKFDQLYDKAKRAVNCLDFADLEHYALRLLSDETSSEDKPIPSQTALLLRQKYRHISVDEYQDINAVQQRILDMLSPGGNILGVGDGKQSIYAFRGAMPDIFLEQVKLASSDPESSLNGLRVDLNVNFRSTKRILDFVNEIFARIMTESFTKIDYDESSRLKPAPEDKSKPQPPKDRNNIIEFHILDKTVSSNDSQVEQGGKYEDDNPDIVTLRQSQAAMIARRIRRMVGADTGKAEFQVYDEQQGVLRDVEYRDIVLLMRSLAKKANDYVEIFRLAGVPVSCQATAGYFEATEINDFVALLKVLDNPQRDIELAAVLRSPIFKVSDTELAKIKLHNKAKKRQKSYYDCVLEYCSDDTDAELSGRLDKILARIEQWRTIARRGKLADLLWRIYRQTDLLSFVSALPNGQSRRANLLKLHDRAIQYEGFASTAGVPSLSRFVEFIEKLQETGQDWAPAEPQSSAGNAVRILSVHKSKGLEFPVVFLAELESQFNKRDVQADCLIDADYTLGLQVIDRESNSKLSSLARQVIQEQKASMGLAEEMRILYVAMTRAKERLILTASQKHSKCPQIISNGFFFDNMPVPDWQLRNCQSPLEWILYGLSGQKTLHQAFETGLAEQAIDDDLLDFKLHDKHDMKKLAKDVIKFKAGKSTQPSTAPKKRYRKQQEQQLLAKVKKSLTWRYQFADTALLPAKSSVTQLTHGNDEYMKFDYSNALDRLPHALLSAEPDSGGHIDGRLIGTATHLVISKLDLSGPITIKAIQKTIEKLLAGGEIAPFVAEQIDTESILTFFETEQGSLIFDPANKVWREWPFTFALPASEWGNSPVEEDTIVIQGIIDLLVRTSRGLAVIDFKTDKITAGQADERTELYRRQLELYSWAACAILKEKPAGKWLYFLTPRVFVEV
jgi:ATP-dependent helicase/nuclease subunit A